MPSTDPDSSTTSRSVIDSSAQAASESFISAPKVNLELLVNTLFPDREVVARRHSLSLCNRTPPPRSLAAEILDSRSDSDFIQTSKNIISNIAEIKEALSDLKPSDFNSAREELSDKGQSSTEKELLNNLTSTQSKVKKKKSENTASFIFNKQWSFIYENNPFQAL